MVIESQGSDGLQGPTGKIQRGLQERTGGPHGLQGPQRHLWTTRTHRKGSQGLQERSGGPHRLQVPSGGAHVGYKDPCGREHNNYLVVINNVVYIIVVTITLV